MVSAAARNGGSQFGMTLLLSRKRSVSPDSREGWLEAEPPAYDAGRVLAALTRALGRMGREPPHDTTGLDPQRSLVLVLDRLR
jgi:hypothetical protein